jgi:hypothetical protein
VTLPSTRGMLTLDPVRRGRRPRMTARELLASVLMATLALLMGAACLQPAEAARPVTDYPLIRGGEWVRGPNLTDAQGRFQPRQEHAAVNLNDFVYLIGGFVPIQPPPAPTSDEPEPFPFEGTGDVLVYTPLGHPSAPAGQQGRWTTLSPASAFPRPMMHHIVAVSHRREIWTFGGHAGPFKPTRLVFRFTPATPGSPEGTWSQVRVSDGKPCGQGDRCLRLPAARAAGAAVSVGRRVYLIGGVVPSRRSPDRVNRSIRTTRSVRYLDTTKFPLTWRTAHRLRVPREHFNAALVNRRIWVFQGRNEASTHLRAVESWAPGQRRWRREQPAPVGASANILAAVGSCVYSFGGEFIASNVSGTLTASQVFDVRRRSWSRLKTTIRTTPLDATGADGKHGTYGVAFVENGTRKIMAPGGAATAWFDPMSKVHVFTAPARCH